MPELAGDPEESDPSWRVSCLLLLLYATAFLVYSQTRAFAWDESYHLLAAQLILAGKTPYLDFCFPQSPLNAYWNAAWMSVFGQSWRTGHAAAALLTFAGVALMADYVARRFRVPSWRPALAVLAALLIGLNPLVFVYGTLSQPYGMCLFAGAAAFRFSVVAVERRGPLLAMGAGLFAGIAAGSSLLSSAAAPVLLLWMWVNNRDGGRTIKSAAFISAVVIPFAPVLYLFARGPRETWFNVVQYHATFRKVYWPESLRHDLEVLFSWIDSAPALVLGLLAMFGLFYIARRSTWAREVKAEFYLCAWLAVALAIEVSLARPTFPQYFLLTVPYLAVLAAAGLYAIGSRLSQLARPAWPVAVALTITALGLGSNLYSLRGISHWTQYERIAAKIEEVTPPSAPLFALEPIYFLTRRMPPPGYELYYTHKVNLPATDRARLHLVTEAEMKQQVQSGHFATAYTCDEDMVENFGLKTLYRQHVDIGDCGVFWDFAPLH